jgi:tetratricopeptide (TPR) repeat protein
MRFRTQFYAFIFFLGFNFTVFAQSEHTEMIPGARALGLGRSQVGGALDASAIYWNPAALAFLRSQQIYVGIARPYSINYFAFSRFSPSLGTFGAAFSAPDINPKGLKTTSVSWAFDFTHSASLGTTVNFHDVNHLIYSTIDFGGYVGIFKNQAWVQRNAWLKEIVQNGNLTFGAVFQNIPLAKRQIRHSVRVGMFYDSYVTGPIWQTAVHIQQPQASFHLGAGFRFFRKFSIIAGVQDFDDQKSAAGLAFNDHNYALQGVFDNATESFTLSLQITLGLDSQQKAQQQTDRGRSSLKQGNYRLALDHFYQSLRYSVENDTVRTLINYLERRRARDDQVIDSLKTVAQGHLARREHILAAFNYVKISQIDPHDQENQANLNALKFQVDRFVDEMYAEALKKLEQGDLKSAKTRLKAVLFIRKEHSSAGQYLKQVTDSLKIIARNYYYRAWGFERQNDLERARREYELALECDEEFKPARERHENLLQLMKQLEQERAQQVNSYMSLARRYNRQNNQLLAHKYYCKALSLKPEDPEAKLAVQRLFPVIENYLKQKLEEGQRFFNQHKLKKAETALKEVISIAELQPELHSYSQQANQYLSRANSVHADECAQLYQVGLSYLQQQKWEAALENFEKMMNLKCNQEAALQKYQETLSIIGADSLFEKGKRYIRQNKYLEARNLFQKVLQTRPNDHEAIENIERCQSELDRIVEEKFNLGMDFYTEENYQAAITQWEEVLQYNPNHRDTNDYLKRARERLHALEKLR